MKRVCEVDGVEFEAKRSTARFCSAKCRVEAARRAGVDPASGEVVKDPTRLAMKRSKTDQGLAQQVGGTSSGGVYDREKNLKAFIKMGVAKVDWIPTGIPGFDELTQIPRGRITQIQGRYGVGKTTLCLNMIKGLKDRKVLYIDAEAALNPDLLVDLELEAKNFTLYNESSYIEDISDVIRVAAKNGLYELIVLDSVPMTTTKSIEASDITAKNIGQKAFIIHKLVELIAMDLKRTNTAMVFINQVRDVIGTPYPDTYTPGGTGIPFQASLIVQLRSAKSWRFPQPKKGTKGHVFLGQEVEATIIKSKVNNPGRVKKFKLFYPNPTEVPVEAIDSKENF